MFRIVKCKNTTCGKTDHKFGAINCDMCGTPLDKKINWAIIFALLFVVASIFAIYFYYNMKMNNSDNIDKPTPVKQREVIVLPPQGQTNRNEPVPPRPRDNTPAATTEQRNEAQTRDVAPIPQIRDVAPSTSRRQPPPPPPTTINGEIPYTFGRYVGEIRNGVPEGEGTMHYNRKVQIAKHSESMYCAEDGDTFVGRWHNGDIERGELKDRNNNRKATIFAGARRSRYDISQNINYDCQ